MAYRDVAVTVVYAMLCCAMLCYAVLCFVQFQSPVIFRGWLVPIYGQPLAGLLFLCSCCCCLSLSSYHIIIIIISDYYVQF